MRTGLVFSAVDSHGQPLQDLVASVYPVTYGSGTLHPLSVLTTPGGALSVPLAVPLADPVHPANFFVVYSGHSSAGGSAGGWRFFTLTPQEPIATVTGTQNVAGPTGPCKWDPTTQQLPPGGAFSIEQVSHPDAPGTIDVGEVHGFGSISNSWQANVRGLAGKVIGEELVTTWTRTTISQALEEIQSPLSQTRWLDLGPNRIGLSQNDVGKSATGGGVAQAGGGARAMVVHAFWAHNEVIFRCHNGQPDETHNTFVPKTWDTNGADTFPTRDSSMDNFVTMANEDVTLGSPLASNDYKFFVHGQTKSYDGFNEGFGITGLFQADVHSESDFGAENQLNIYGSAGCGNSDGTTIWCYYWQAPSDNQARYCPDLDACHSDIYTAVTPAPPLVPGPAPRPCTDRTPHNPCD